MHTSVCAGDTAGARGEPLSPCPPTVDRAAATDLERRTLEAARLAILEAIERAPSAGGWVG